MSDAETEGFQRNDDNEDAQGGAESEGFPRNEFSKDSGGAKPEKQRSKNKKKFTKKKPGQESKKGRLVVRNIPFNATEMGLLELFQQYGNVTEVKLLRKDDGKLVGCGFVNFENAKSAGKALAHISGKPYLGRTMIVDWAVPKTVYHSAVDQDFRVGQMKPKQSDVDLPEGAFRPKKSYHELNLNRNDARLFVTNLPFKISEDDLRSYMSQYGPVVDLFIIRRNGRQMGNGFVTFKSRSVAEEAIEKLEGREFQGRPLYFKWAEPKKRAGYPSENGGLKRENVEIKEEVFSDEENYRPKSKKTKIQEKPSFSFSVDGDTTLDTSSIKSENESSEDENEDSENDDSFNRSSKENGISKKSKKENDSEDDDDDDSDDDEESNDSERDSKQKIKENAKNKNVKEEKSRESNDISEGLTVFLRNVPFDVDKDELRKFITARFGPVYYALVCIDPSTEYSRGTAFVKFRNQDSVNAILNAGEDLVLHDELMQASMALSRDEIGTKQSIKNKAGEKNDNRNLYLSKEGLILAGSKAAKDVSITDMNKRLSIENTRARILKKNLLMFVSTKRLVIYNLPPNYTDVQLKELFQKHSPKNAVITEARVMKDMKKFNNKGTFASREFGYVTFTTHEDAKEALQTINNNPDIFIKTKRPIVLFSIENRQAIATKEKRLEKSRKNNPLFTGETRVKKKFEKTQNGGKPFKDQDGSQVKSSDERQYRGFTAAPGKTVLKSGYKIRKQAQTHAKNVKKTKKLLRQKRQMAQLLEDKEMRKGADNKTKKRKRSAEEMESQGDRKFERLVSEHKSDDAIQSKKFKKAKIHADPGEPQRKKKWYDN